MLKEVGRTILDIQGSKPATYERRIILKPGEKIVSADVSVLENLPTSIAFKIFVDEDDLGVFPSLTEEKPKLRSKNES